jgi:iron-sulfur cluster repair protein YtfE (RIC family)
MSAALESLRFKPPDNLIGAMLENHGKARELLGLARLTGSSVELSDRRTAQACARVERYFRDGFPQLTEVEERHIFPRLRAWGSALDVTLRMMSEQHRAQEPGVRALVQLCSALREQPCNARQRAQLVATVDDLERDLDEHLAFEETVIFEEVRRLLPVPLQLEILEALRVTAGSETTSGSSPRGEAGRV